MELKPIRCTQCGANFDTYDPSARFMKCTRMGCGALFVVEQGVSFASIEKQKAEQIANLRKTLEKQIKANNLPQVYEYASQIQALLPDDFTANFWNALLSVHLNDMEPDIYHKFLSEEHLCAPEEAEKCINGAIQFASDEFSDEIIEFIRRHLDAAQARAMERRLMGRLVEIHRQSQISGDVFIMHAYGTKPLASELYESLVEGGINAWVDAKNMPVGTSGYRERIKNALEGCQLVLVVYSEALSRDNIAKGQIRAALDSGKALVILNADGSPLSDLFKRYAESWPLVELDDPEMLAKLRDAIDGALSPQAVIAPDTVIIAPPEAAPALDEGGFESLPPLDLSPCSAPLEAPEEPLNLPDMIIDISDLDGKKEAVEEDDFSPPPFDPEYKKSAAGYKPSAFETEQPPKSEADILREKNVSKAIDLLNNLLISHNRYTAEKHPDEQADDDTFEPLPFL